MNMRNGQTEGCEFMTSRSIPASSVTLHALPKHELKLFSRFETAYQHEECSAMQEAVYRYGARIIPDVLLAYMYNLIEERSRMLSNRDSILKYSHPAGKLMRCLPKRHL